MSIFNFAGLYGPEALLSQTGTPFALGSVQIYESDGITAASIYTSQTMGTPAANPTTCDSFGNLKFFAQPGYYVLSFTIGGVTNTLTVQVPPFFTDTSSGMVVESYIGSPVSVAESGNTNLTSVSLPAGTWLVTARGTIYSGGGGEGQIDAWIGPTSASTSGAYAGAGDDLNVAAAETSLFNFTIVKQVVLSTTTTVYLIAAFNSSSPGEALAATDYRSIPNVTGITAVAMNAQT